MAYNTPLLAHDLFVAHPPEFPVRRADDPTGPDAVVKIAPTAEDERGVTFSGVTQAGRPVKGSVGLAAPGIVRVLLEGEMADPGRVRLARPVAQPPPAVRIEKSTDRVTLVSDLVRVQLDLDPLHITFYGADGRAFLEQNASDTDVTDRLIVLPFGFSEVDGRRVVFHDTFTAEPDEHFYGFGEKFTDFDKRGQRLEMWNYDAYGAWGEWAYKNVPFLVSSRGYGIFVDSVSRVNFDMAFSNHSVFSLIVPDSALDYYVIVGPDLKSVVSRYAGLVSFPTLPPKWAFGLWMSSGFKDDNADQVLRRARELREHAVPCDVLHLDCYWQRFGRWSEMLWDKAAFPDPEGMLRQVKALGFKVCLWMNPYLGTESERFVEGSQKGYLLKTPRGDAYVCALWGKSHPPVGIIDVTNPAAAAWFGDMLRPLLRMGVDVFKTDFGEGVPADAVAHNGMAGERLHNLYPLLYNDLVARVTAEETGRAGLVWGRSSYAGGQRHAAQWSGDPNCTYPAMASTLRGGLSMAMCGHAFWSHDIGGFHRQPTPDLYARWAQFGLLSPLSRAHGMTSRLPWDYGEPALTIFREAVRLRYRLLPYIYTTASLAVETGLPVMRPMVLEFPDDPMTYTLDLQYMFGADLLVAPVYNGSGRRPVYLPAGRWADFWTHEVIAGPQARWIEAPLDRLPLYVRAGALIPTIEPSQHLTGDPFPFVTFDAYLLERGSGELRDTDGATRVSAAFAGKCLEVRAEGVKHKFGLRAIPLAGAPPVEHVVCNGAPLPRLDRLELGPESPPGWTLAADGTLEAVIRW